MGLKSAASKADILMPKTDEQGGKSEIRQLGFLGAPGVKNSPALAGDRVQSLVQEDPTCHEATKPVCYNC